jgi:hypothetical protein
MSYIHKHLLRKGRLSDLLPDEADVGSGDRPEIEAAKAEIRVRAVKERQASREVAAAVVRLRELDKRNHYGDSLKRAFGGM